MIRYFLPGSVWVVAMWLLFLTPVNEPVHRLVAYIPARSMIYCVLFMGFSHLWLGGLKKQLKYESLRRNAFYIVPSVAVIMMIGGELVGFISGIGVGITTWNILFESIGTVLGILSFRLLYHQCY